MSSEKGVGKRRGGGESTETQPRARSGASSPANPGTCSPSHCTEEDPTPGEPWARSHGRSAPGQRVLAGGTCNRPLGRRLQPRERTAPPNRPLRPGPRGSSPRRGAAAGRGCHGVGCKIRLFRSDLLRPGFIVCGAFWGWGGSCASAAAAASAAAVASAARRAGGSWAVDALLPPPPALRASPRPLPAGTSPGVHLKGTGIMV